MPYEVILNCKSARQVNAMIEVLAQAKARGEFEDWELKSFGVSSAKIWVSSETDDAFAKGCMLFLKTAKPYIADIEAIHYVVNLHTESILLSGMMSDWNEVPDAPAVESKDSEQLQTEPEMPLKLNKPMLKACTNLQELKEEILGMENNWLLIEIYGHLSHPFQYKVLDVDDDSFVARSGRRGTKCIMFGEESQWDFTEEGAIKYPDPENPDTPAELIIFFNRLQ